VRLASWVCTQANVKGWLIRKRWAADRHAVVDALHARIAAQVWGGAPKPMLDAWSA